MKLEDNFYYIRSLVSDTDNTYSFVIEINNQHNIFNGHFPQKAVVPGVCTLTIIKECLCKILNKNVSFASIKECKYISPLLPESGLEIMIKITLVKDNELMCTVKRYNGDDIVLKLKAVYK